MTNGESLLGGEMRRFHVEVRTGGSNGGEA